MALAIFSHETHIDFVGFRKIAYAISCITALIGLVAILLNGGLKYGVDFTGGVIVQIAFEQSIPDEQVKTALEDVNLPGLIVQQVDTDNRNYMLRFSVSDESTQELRQRVTDTLHKTLPNNKFTLQRIESVGPKVGSDLRNMAIEAVFYAVLLITVYISGRFEYSWITAGLMVAVLYGAVYGVSYLGLSKLWGVFLGLIITFVSCWKLKLNFALGATLALVHDVIITVGLLTLLNIEIDLNVIAALLTLVGYSINDTIVVYDRIRENLRNIPHDGNIKPTMESVINVSVNQTLARTVMTSGTTLLASLALYFLGGNVIHSFALTITLGIIFGTFSSVFVASPILIAFGNVDFYHTKVSQKVEFERPGEHGVV